MLDEGQRPLLETANGPHPQGARAIPIGARPVADTGPLSDPMPEDDALLMCTSRTTGRPKGVLHSHASLLAGGWTTATAHALAAEDRALGVLPLYHIQRLLRDAEGPLVSGGAVVVCDRFSGGRFWQDCGRHEATWFPVVPTIVSHLLHGGAEPDEATRAGLRFGRSASSALTVETQQGFERRFDVPSWRRWALPRRRRRSCRTRCPPETGGIGSHGQAWGNDLVVLSPDFAPSAPRIEGENAMREPNVMRGCSRDADETATAVKLREGARVEAGALPDLCEARLGAFESPDVVHILPDLPKGPSRKIQRLRLAQMIE